MAQSPGYACVALFLVDQARPESWPPTVMSPKPELKLIGVALGAMAPACALLAAASVMAARPARQPKIYRKKFFHRDHALFAFM